MSPLISAGDTYVRSSKPVIRETHTTLDDSFKTEDSDLNVGDNDA